MSRHLVYRLAVYVTVPLADDPDDPDYPTLEGATDLAFKRGIEKAASQCLKRMEQECDVEVVDFVVREDA